MSRAIGTMVGLVVFVAVALAADWLIVHALRALFGALT